MVRSSVDIAEAMAPLCVTCGGDTAESDVSAAQCESCALKNCIEVTRRLCLQTGSRNPLEIALAIMSEPCTRLNGREHHFLVGAALLAAFKNCGGEIDLEMALDTIIERGRCIPYGICTAWGTCGAGISSGTYISMISRAAKLSNNDERGLVAVMTSRSMGLIAAQKGPRCCKRDSFTAILEAAGVTSRVFGLEMELPRRFECGFYNANSNCVGGDCRFFPVHMQSLEII